MAYKVIYGVGRLVFYWCHFPVFCHAGNDNTGINGIIGSIGLAECMLKASLLAAGLMIITGCTSGRGARRSVDWSILIVIAAEAIATGLIELAGGNIFTSLALMFSTTALLTAMATNNAAAIIMFPIAVTTANNLNVSIMPFVITIMIAASASFATPIGYQTNLMVYGVGGYHFSDYLRIGIPLTLLVGLTTILLVPVIWDF